MINRKYIYKTLLKFKRRNIRNNKKRQTPPCKKRKTGLSAQFSKNTHENNNKISDLPK